MFFHVDLQLARSSTKVVALFAGKRFLTSVGEHVHLEVLISCAGITALVTGEGLL